MKNMNRLFVPTSALYTPLSETERSRASHLMMANCPRKDIADS